MNQDDAAIVFSPQGPPRTIPMTRMPGFIGIFSKLIALSLVRPSDISSDTVLENAAVTFKSHRADPKKLEGFKQICGYPRDMATLPAPFIQTLFIGMAARFIGSGHFPITPMGLIQVGQTLEMHHPVRAETPLDLSCRLVDMTRTGRGICTRIRMEARTANRSDNEKPVWTGTAAYFTRARHPGPKNKSTIQETPRPVKETIAVPKDIGRRYAAVSRDFNPHHLYGWTARLIGFKRPIAHGMWSLARTCAGLEKVFGYPDLFKLDVAFKLPVFLPAAVSLGYDILDPADGTGAAGADFELRDAKKKIPHLIGTFRF